MWLSLFFSVQLAHAEPACPETVAGLPISSLLSVDDARLQGDNLIVALKEKRKIMRYTHGVLVGGHCWDMGLASGYPAGTKQRRGDMKTPEGWYRTSDKPWSSYYHAIAVHYPSTQDARNGERAGLISATQRASIQAAIKKDRKPDQGTRLGGEILIHGGGGSSDWTLGCLAMDDADIDALRGTLNDTFRTDILILP